MDTTLGNDNLSGENGLDLEVPLKIKTKKLPPQNVN